MRQPGRTQSRLAHRSRPQHQRIRVLHRTTSHIWLLAIVLSSMAGCTEAGNPNFPQLHGGPVGLDALLVGELVSENGCLRIRDTDGRADFLLIWSDAAEMTADGQGVRIRDNSGASLSFSVGDEMEMGGGEAKFSHVQNIVKQPIPSDCPGPYWLVGVSVSSSQ